MLYNRGCGGEEGEVLSSLVAGLIEGGLWQSVGGCGVVQFGSMGRATVVGSEIGGLPLCWGVGGVA